jgi:hypothetical protein
MRTPTEYELKHGPLYDPVKAHQYYLRTRQLKGRRKGTAEDYDVDSRAENRAQQRRALAKVNGADPRTGKKMGQIHREARARQRKELTQQVDRLQARLGKLEALIQKRETEATSEDRKSKAKKERASKEREKPKSAAEKAEAARESEKYRKKHKQELKNEAKDASDKSGGGSSSDKKKSGLKRRSTEDLKAMATKVRGQIAVAKQKLAAL